MSGRTRRRSTAEQALWTVLETVADPEVPVLSIVDLGIVRDVRREDGAVVVDVTPTYSGCPAMRVIEREIVLALERAGERAVRVNTVFQPAWTTDWLTDDAKERLRAFGIAPPGPAPRGDDELIPLRRHPNPTPCPFCGSTRTEMRSEFGSTACKSLNVCLACRQPFEAFKAI